MLFKDSWQNKKVFNKQLQLCKKQLDASTYPSHWQFVLDCLKDKKGKLLDIGCGIGGVCKLLEKENKYIEYSGIDYAPEAVIIANKEWGNHFNVLPYQDLDNNIIENYDFVLSCALVNVLDDGLSCFDFLLRLNGKEYIFPKLNIDDNSHLKIINGYTGEETYDSFYTIDEYISIIDKYDYTIVSKTVYKKSLNLNIKHEDK